MSRWIVWLGPVLILLVSAVLYSNSTDHARLTEDRAVVWGNDAVTGESLGPALLGHFYTHERTFHRAIRPVSTIANRIAFGRFDQNRTPFQWRLILLHGLAGALLAIAIGKTLGSPIAGSVAGLVFVCHAALTQSVLRLAGVSEILALIFSLIALLAANRALQSRDLRDGRQGISLTVCWLSVLFALWSKEIAIVIVPALWLWAATISRGEPTRNKSGGQVSDGVILSVGVLVAALVALGFRSISMGTLSENVRLATEVYSDTGDDFGSRFLVGLATIPSYARLIFFPERLGTNYDFLGALESSALQLRWIGGVVALVILLAGVVIAWFRRQAGAVLWGTLTLGSLIAALGILAPTGDYLNERCLYFLLPSVLGWLTWGAVTFLADRENTRLEIAAVVLGVIVAAGLGARTIARADDFTNQETLLRAQITTYPESARAHFDLGSIFLSRGNSERAQAEYEKALKIDPQLWMAWANVGVIYSRQDNLSLAVRAYSQALRGMSGRTGYRGEEARTHFNAGIVMMKQNRNRNASDEFLRTVEVFPNHLRAHANLGFVFSNDSKSDEQALYHLGRAIELEPDLKRRQSLIGLVTTVKTRRAELDQHRQERIDAGFEEEEPEPSTIPE